MSAYQLNMLRMKAVNRFRSEYHAVGVVLLRCQTIGSSCWSSIRTPHDTTD
jgi:hypothetical protein